MAERAGIRGSGRAQDLGAGQGLGAAQGLGPGQGLGRAQGLGRRPGRRMARRLLAATSVAALAATPVLAASTPAHAATAAFSGVVLNSFEARLVSDVNAARAADGLGALQVAAGTTEVARAWATHLAAVGSLSHNPSLLADLESHGSPNWTFAAENVGYGPASDADTLFTAYMNSPEHRANILAAQARYIGMGAVAGANGTEFNTMDFVDSYSGALAETAPASVPQVTRTSSPSAPMALYPSSGIVHYTTAGYDGSWASRPYLAPTTLGVVVRFAAHAGRAGGVVFEQHSPISLAGQSALHLRLAGVNRSGRSMSALVVIDTPGGWVSLGWVPLVQATRWVSVAIPSADRTVASRTEIYLPAGQLAAVGGSELVAFGPEIG